MAHDQGAAQTVDGETFGGWNPDALPKWLVSQLAPFTAEARARKLSELLGSLNAARSEGRSAPPVTEGVRKGFVLVPREPTSAMLKVGAEAVRGGIVGQSSYREDAANAYRAMIAASLIQGGGWRPTHRHVRRGTTYRVVAEGLLQTASQAVWDETPLTIYQGEDARWWARPTDEFNDGRFEPMST